MVSAVLSFAGSTSPASSWATGGESGSRPCSAPRLWGPAAVSWGGQWTIERLQQPARPPAAVMGRQHAAQLEAAGQPPGLWSNGDEFWGSRKRAQGRPAQQASTCQARAVLAPAGGGGSFERAAAICCLPLAHKLLRLALPCSTATVAAQQPSKQQSEQRRNAAEADWRIRLRQQQRCRRRNRAPHLQPTAAAALSSCSLSKSRPWCR